MCSERVEKGRAYTCIPPIYMYIYIHKTLERCMKRFFSGTQPTNIKLHGIHCEPVFTQGPLCMYIYIFFLNTCIHLLYFLFIACKHNAYCTFVENIFFC